MNTATKKAGDGFGAARRRCVARGAALAFAAAAIPGAAGAQTAVRVLNPLLMVQDQAAIASIQQMNTQFNANLVAQTQLVIEALRGHSSQQTANMQRAVQADGTMRETQDNRMVQHAVEGRRINAQLATQGGAVGCNIMTGVIGSTALFATANQARSQLTTLAGDYQFGERPGSSVRNGTRAALEERLSATCREFGTPSMVDDGTCSVAVQPEGISRALNAEPLLGASVLGPDAQRAARVFVANAFVAAPMAPVARSIAGTEEGREIAAARHTAMARNSIAMSAFNDSMAMRVPMPRGVAGGGGETVDRWAEGTASRMLGGQASGNFPDGVSLYAWMDLRARSFYLDPNFQLRVNSQDADQNSKDAVLIQGFQTFLQWHQFQQAERTNVLLSNLLSIMAEEAQSRRVGIAR